MKNRVKVKRLLATRLDVATNELSLERELQNVLYELGDVEIHSITSTHLHNDPNNPNWEHVLVIIHYTTKY